MNENAIQKKRGKERKKEENRFIFIHQLFKQEHSQTFF